MTDAKFSVLMSVYTGETVSFFREAVESVLNQTVKPDEIILVRDGKVYDELQCAIDGYVSTYPNLFTYIPLEANGGLGNALHTGVSAAKHELIARMDTDDLCVPDRFEKQLAFMNQHPEISVCGGQIYEFIEATDQIEGIRSVPTEDAAIKKFMQSRNPFNHMTVMFRKSAVIKAGNYLDMHYVEDYYLWCRMRIDGCSFGNLDDILVYARIGKDMYKRRGGYKYFCSWKQLEKFKLDHGITSLGQYIKTLMMRFSVQVLMPNGIRGFIMKKFSRSSKM